MTDSAARQVNAQATPDLRLIVERDRSMVAESVTNIEKVISERGWIAEGRGSYEYDDDRYRQEFSWAIAEIRKALEPLQKIASDMEYSPRTHEEVMTARAIPIEADGPLFRQAASVPAPAPSMEPFQSRVNMWFLSCFGEEISRDKVERNHRFVEESLELVQSLGCTASEAHQLVDYVFSRPVGNPPQEVGGAMTTLAALCLANGIDMQATADAELVSNWQRIDKIRAKQAAKPKHSPLPLAPAPSEAPHFPIALNDSQEQCVKIWAADMRCWATPETVEFNLRTFARKIIGESGQPGAPSEAKPTTELKSEKAEEGFYKWWQPKTLIGGRFYGCSENWGAKDAWVAARSAQTYFGRGR